MAKVTMWQYWDYDMAGVQAGVATNYLSWLDPLPSANDSVETVRGPHQIWVNDYYEEECTYRGTFTYTYDADHWATGVQGRVTAFSESYNDSAGYYGGGINITGLDVDISVFRQGLSGSELAELLLAGNDVIIGTSLNDDLYGFGGNDRLEAGEGKDHLYGLQGADTMLGGANNDVYYVNAQSRVVELADGGTDTVLSGVSYTLPGYVEHLTLRGATSLNGSGNALANHITGNLGANLLSGLAGDDTLEGGGGNDTLRGGAGADRLRGDAGADVFRFDLASDSLPTRSDLIQDFVSGVDRINLRPIDANGGTAINNAFTFIGTAAFSSTNATGQLRFHYDAASNKGVLEGSTDADAAAEFTIRLVGVHALAASDIDL